MVGSQSDVEVSRRKGISSIFYRQLLPDRQRGALTRSEIGHWNIGSTWEKNWHLDLNVETSPQAKRHKSSHSHHFSSPLFTFLYILTSLALINWKATTIHIHISNISLNFSSLLSEKFSLSLLLSMERRKQYKYINKTTQKVQPSSYIFVTHPDKFEILWNQGYTKSSIKFALVENLATRWRH